MSREPISRDDAFEHLHSKRDLIHWALRRKFPRTDHEDTVQEAIIYTAKNHQSWSKFNIVSLAVKKAVMLTVDRIRSAACRNPLTSYDAAMDEDAVCPDPFNESNDLMTIAKIDEALPESYQGIFLMSYCGYSYQEIAELTGITAHAVKCRIHRARKIIKQGGTLDPF